MSDTHCHACGTPWTNKVPFWVTERTQVARYRSALEAIRDYDSFQGGPRAPRASVVENAMRELAGSALVGS